MGEGADVVLRVLLTLAVFGLAAAMFGVISLIYSLSQHVNFG